MIHDQLGDVETNKAKPARPVPQPRAGAGALRQRSGWPILRCRVEGLAWQSLGESNPSPQIENLMS